MKRFTLFQKLVFITTLLLLATWLFSVFFVAHGSAINTIVAFGGGSLAIWYPTKPASEPWHLGPAPDFFTPVFPAFFQCRPGSTVNVFLPLWIPLSLLLAMTLVCYVPKLFNYSSNKEIDA
jgi:hypothetical protein